jgi:hypothetical protein
MDLPIRSALAFGAFTLSLSAAFGWTVGHYLSISAEEQAIARAQSTAAQFAERLDLTVWARAHELLAFSAATPLAEPALRAQHARRFLDGIRRSLPAFRWVGVADAEGRIVHATGGELEGAYVGGLPAYRQARAAPQVLGLKDAVLTGRASDAMRDGQPVRFLDLSVATFDGVGNRTGVLLAQLGWDWAVESAQAAARAVDAGSRSELMVIAADGRVLLSSNPDMNGRTLATSMAVGPRTDGRWSSIRRWPDGERYLTVASPSRGYGDFPGLGWTVVLRQPLDLALGGSATVPRKVAIAAALVAALGLLVGGWLGIAQAAARGTGRGSTAPAAASGASPAHAVAARSAGRGGIDDRTAGA